MASSLGRTASSFQQITGFNTGPFPRSNSQTLFVPASNNIVAPIAGIMMVWANFRFDGMASGTYYRLNIFKNGVQVNKCLIILIIF